MKTQFEHKDLLMGCTILVSLTKDEISVSVGGRDIQWSRKTGEVIGAGCMLDEPVPTVSKKVA
jgi:hypothetical protein